MIRYYVELDGISIIKSQIILEKDDIITVDDDGERHHYRVRSKDGQNLALRLLKTVEDVEEGVKYYLDDIELSFESRLSKNQIIVVDEYLYKVLDIEKKTNILTLETMDREIVFVLYGVYASRDSEGLTIRDREKGDYMAEKYFRKWGDAIHYVGAERRKGRKISL